MTPTEPEAPTRAERDFIRPLLVKHGWLVAAGDEDSDGPAGHSGDLVTPLAGVDVGGTKLHVALVDADGQRIHERVARTDRRGGRWVTAQVADMLSDLSAEAGLVSPPHVVALGCPGVPDITSGRVTHAPNIPGWDTFDVADDLAGRLGARVSMHNDVTLAAWGEHVWANGPANGEDLALIALGTGIGLGLVIGGRMYPGSRGMAGEISHLPFGSDPFDPENRTVGPLERELSGAGLQRRYLIAGGKRPLSMPEIFAAAADDKVAESVLEDLGRLLALAASSIQVILDPPAILLGGGIGSRPETLMATRRWLGRLAGPPVNLATSQLGPRATVAGALAVACAGAC